MREQLFTKQELQTLRLLGPRIRGKKIDAMLQAKLSEPFYQKMSDEEKHKWLRRQAYLHDQSLFNPGYLVPGFFLGLIVFTAVVEVSAGLGLFLALAIWITFLYLSYSNNTYFLKEYFLKEARVMGSVLQKASEEEIREYEEKVRMASSRSLELFEAIKENPKLNIGRFPEYRDYVDIEIASSSPGQQYLTQKHGEREALNELLIQFAGTWTKGYVPVNDQKFSAMLKILEREMARVKELTQYTRLPFQIIEHYQEIARTYYGLHREGGSASIYDEQKITNEILAMKESLVIHGDYIDESVSHNHSVTHNTNIANAVIDNGDYSHEKIKKEIIRLILSSDNESASRIELMGEIPVKESQLLAALEDLQQSQKIQIGNRESGEVFYRLDRLA